MSNLKDITGQKFGRLIAIERTNNRNGTSYIWKFKCDCGNEHFVPINRVIRGSTQSCGCLRRELSRLGSKGKGNLKHGMRWTREYRIWLGMLDRCRNPKNKNFKSYGGRGIKVCDRWHKFENFYEDMGNSPKGLSIHRVNNDGNYCKENCIWTDSKTQAKHSRNNRYIEYNGKIKPLWEWSEIFNLNKDLIRSRLDNGWTTEETFNIPVNKRKLNV